MRSGGLFAGYGGLDMAVAEVFGAQPAWFSEIDDAPSKILAHHWPDVPNHGDITQIDWDAVEPVDILSGGFPCQDVSAAGKRAGLHPGTRSGLWNHMAYAISKLRPRYVVAENVRGLLSAEAHSDVEPCPWCLGDGSGEPALRALGAVLADLADLGYDAQGCGLRAADVGAPHGRFRFFILAADTHQSGSQGSEPATGLILPAWGSAAHADRDPVWEQPVTLTRSGSAPIPGLTGAIAANADGAGGEARSGRPGAGDAGRLQSLVGGGADREPKGHTATNTASVGLNRRAGTNSEPVGRGERPSRADTHGRGQAATDSQSYGRHEGWTEPAGQLGGSDAAERSSSPVAWGGYRPAIERWERVLGRHAPAPTETSAKGGQRLSPRFVEWMMGLPAGHVTDVPGVNRNAQLKALGNGVVPQQAIAALRHMLSVREVAA